tara:strand:- start:378 stop:623 length:246 start_codon:yes stop_codon:yes gene_type:complete
MIVSSKKDKETFQSFDIVLTIESEEDAAKLFCVCNHCSNTSFFNALAQVRTALKTHIPGIDMSSAYARCWGRFQESRKQNG